MNTKNNLVLNGRFLTRSMTGVDRVASELAVALTQISPETDMHLALPSAPVHAPETTPEEILNLDKLGQSRHSGHLWEQVELPRLLESDQWLLSLCNTGPVMRSRQAVMIHDAQVFTQPASYSRAFRSLYRVLLPTLARRSRVLLTVSDFSRLELEKHGVFPEGKARVIHNGVDHLAEISPDTEALARHGLEPGGYFLAIGSLAPHKNLRLLASAAQARDKGSLPLIVAGGGNSTVFKDDGLVEHEGLRFLGRVSDNELKALYNDAYALLFPSLTEGFGLPPLEAMSCGCPVLATTGGAVPEVCGDAALFVDPRQQQDWTDAMLRIEAEPNLRTDLAGKGRERAAMFTWKRAAEQLLTALDEAS
ncbi:glycosyltransferase family 4 protein [Ruegeria arenilitoris]|uniref:glycosyltransferase family 4 protein n=1 Tax=Ruegeria arenilitoris TaxID=1173585 RepID=UPI00147E1DE9|nr:glycosyltransferase family 1 protein [Ruegeria arenilitoris]